MAANDVFISAYCWFLTALIKQFLLYKLQNSDSQYKADFLTEIYIFWQPMAARYSISLWQLYDTLMVAICR